MTHQGHGTPGARRSRTRDPGQDIQDKTSRTRHPGQDIQDKTSRVWHTRRKEIQDKTSRTRHPGQGYPMSHSGHDTPGACDPGTPISKYLDGKSNATMANQMPRWQIKCSTGKPTPLGVLGTQQPGQDIPDKETHWHTPATQWHTRTRHVNPFAHSGHCAPWVWHTRGMRPIGTPRDKTPRDKTPRDKTPRATQCHPGTRHVTLGLTQ
jgi:hypothetical protein